MISNDVISPNRTAPPSDADSGDVSAAHNDARANMHTEEERLTQREKPLSAANANGIERAIQRGSVLDYVKSSSVWLYYPLLRFLGYVFSTSYTPLKEFTARRIKEYEHTRNPALNKFESINRPVSYDAPPENWHRWFDRLHEQEKEKSHYESRAKKLITRVEAFFFAALTTFSFFVERKKLKENMGLAVAAEFGIEPEKVGLRHMWKSKNPFIHSATTRHRWQTAIRYATDATFLTGNLTAALVAEAGRTTLERSAFVIDKLPYDLLMNMLNEVQVQHLMVNADQRLANGFANALQRVHLGLNEAQMSALKPVFQKMAEGALQKNVKTGQPSLGPNEIIYLVGTSINANDPVASLEQVEKIIAFGLRGIVQEKRTGVALSMPDERQETPHKMAGQVGYDRAVTQQDMSDLRARPALEVIKHTRNDVRAIVAGGPQKPGFQARESAAPVQLGS